MTSASVSLSFNSTWVSRTHSANISLNDDFSISEILDFSDSETVKYESFQNEFYAYYGDRLADEVESEYGPFKKEWITVKEIKQRLVSAAALVKKEDLEFLFDQIHAHGKDLGCKTLLTFDEKSEIRSVTRFKRLKNHQLEILISAYRYLPNSKQDMQAIGSLLYPLKKYPKIPNHSKVFHKHLTMIRAFERAEHFLQKKSKSKKNFALRQKLAASEHLSREISYGIPLNNELENQINVLMKKKLLTPSEIQQAIADLIKKEVVGTIFPTLNDKGQKVFYEIKSSVFENGLVAFFCAPFTEGQWKKNGSTDTPYPIKALFRGTWCYSSLKRDLTEGLEVGQNSFFGLSPSIVEALEECIPGEADNVSADIQGHSLGGVDASRLVVLLAKQRVERQRELGEDHESKLDQIRTIKLTTWNSPGVLKSTCREYNENVAEIKKNPILPLSFQHTHVKVGEDVFQNFGKTLLGWQDPKVVKKSHKSIRNHNTKVIKFHFKRFHTIIGTTWFAHRLPCLSVDAKDTRMRVKRGKINRKLGPRGLCRWIKLIAKAVFRRARRIPIVICKFIKRLIIKEAHKDYHKIYKALGIRKIFNPLKLNLAMP